MKGPKFARTCDGCERRTPARWRTILDRYLCAGCYMAALTLQRDTPIGLVGVPPGLPVIVGAQQTGKSITTDGWSVPKDDEPEFDLRHLTGAK